MNKLKLLYVTSAIVLLGVVLFVNMQSSAQATPEAYLAALEAGRERMLGISPNEIVTIARKSEGERRLPASALASIAERAEPRYTNGGVAGRLSCEGPMVRRVCSFGEEMNTRGRAILDQAETRGDLIRIVILWQHQYHSKAKDKEDVFRAWTTVDLRAVGGSFEVENVTVTET